MRGKGTAIATAAALLAVMVAAAFLLKERALEEWYLRKLLKGDRAEQAEALQRLAESGGEKAWVSLAALPAKQTYLKAIKLEDGSCLKCMRSSRDWGREIAMRIGPDRILSSFEKALEDPHLPSRLKFTLAMWVTSYTTRQEDQNLILWNGSNGFRLRQAAVAALVAFLSCSDQWILDRSIVALSFFGPEAVTAIPELERLANDPDEGVKLTAVMALIMIKPEVTAR